MATPFERYRVPDLTPAERAELRDAKIRFIFVAESPHTHEIAADSPAERRPLCGAAGKKWWSALGEFLEGDASEDVSLSRMLRLCRTHGIAILNAVQYPLDCAITRTEPKADPLRTVGFCKNAGADSYKKQKSSLKMREMLTSLRSRLEAPELAGAPIRCLGNDARWFVEQALGPEETKRRLEDRLYHPSAWWRKGGHFGRVSREKLRELLG
ncbi:MAG: hypothetical protein NDJ90_08510 [Oligoflexia bacterium]|nr:hypothetical protein [Oligoflexia bacterium]